MLNLIKNELEKQKNTSITENGAIGYKSTNSALVDINYQVSSLRNSSEEEIIKLFDNCFHENNEYALKWLFFARDVRGGLGERRLFRICYKRLLELNKDLFILNLKNISEYGRWDDLISLLGISKLTDVIIINIVKNQLNSDISAKLLNEPISLLAKWLPSENASSKKTKEMGKFVRKSLGLSSRKYRVLLSELRNYLNVVEVKMCANEWNDIDYDKVPSLANLKYSNAFLKHDKDRRLSYLDSVRCGKSKMNMGVATPVDIVSKYNTSYYHVSDFDDSLELAWKNLKDISVQDTLVVADGSGSMTLPVSHNITALDVANALAIYTSEHNNGIYKDKYITFSNTPQFVDLSNDESLRDKLITSREHSEISNTNIEAVFRLILNVAVKYNISEDEMIKNILIISDMEFDEAQRSWESNEVLSEPLFNMIKKDYADNGYKLPKLIFWNVNSRTKTIPLIENELGVVLVSGFSQNVLKMVMSNKLNPYDVLIETITSERYDKIIV